jgi:dienelactone hydrolase
VFQALTASTSTLPWYCQRGQQKRRRSWGCTVAAVRSRRAMGSGRFCWLRLTTSFCCRTASAPGDLVRNAPKTEREVTPSGLRRQDAIEAAQWLAARPGTPPGGVALIGWSNGGSTVLATARAAADLPLGLFQRFAAFYPGCPSPDEVPSWKSSAPMMILMGEDDDWTPAPPCHDLATRYPNAVTFVAYPGAYHDFAAPGRPVKVRNGAATAAGGMAHAGTNEPARQDALERLPKWVEETR